jgi:hypothetical protein
MLAISDEIHPRPRLIELASAPAAAAPVGEPHRCEGSVPDRATAERPMARADGDDAKARLAANR